MEVELFAPLGCWRATDAPGERATTTAPPGRYTVTLFRQEAHLRPVAGEAIYKLTIRALADAHARGDMKEMAADATDTLSAGH